ncbi:MAG: uroporphyrinogen-III synthase [Methylovirgula sp.]
MRILVTRARDEAKRTVEKLAGLGHQAVVSSVLEMAPTGMQWPHGVMDAVLATSAQAFELGDFAPEWPLPEARRLLPLFLVGSRTLEAARQCGFVGEAVLAADVKELAGIVIAKMQAPARLLYLAGRDRKSDLEISCKEAGLDILVVEIYEACAAETLSDEAINAMIKGQIDAVLHYSRRSAEIFLALAQAAGVDPIFLHHMAISADAAAPLQAVGMLLVAIAAEPNEQALLALLSDAQAASGVAWAASREL